MVIFPGIVTTASFIADRTHTLPSLSWHMSVSLNQLETRILLPLMCTYYFTKQSCLENPRAERNLFHVAPSHLKYHLRRMWLSQLWHPYYGPEAVVQTADHEEGRRVEGKAQNCGIRPGASQLQDLCESFVRVEQWEKPALRCIQLGYQDKPTKYQPDSGEGDSVYKVPVTRA